MNLFAETKILREELDKMEEERVQFSRMIKDARRRLREFLVNIDKANPFILEKETRGSLNENGVQMRQETNKICYKRLSCNYENPEEELRLAATRKARSFSKKSRPNYVKKRFRHSVIGNGNEFSDLDEALLLDPSLIEEENDALYSQEHSTAKSVEYSFTKYLSELYANDVADTKDNFASRVRRSKNKEIPVANLLGLDEQVANIEPKKATTKNRENRRTFTNGLNSNHEEYEEYILPDEIPDHFGQNTRFHSAEISGFSPVNTESPASVAFSREQKRRLKRKMKQALKKPENYFYMGNL